MPTHEAAQSSLHVDRAKIFTIPDGMEDQRATKFCNKDVKVRLIRWSFMALLPLVFLFALTLDEGAHLSELIGVAVEFMFICYFSLVSYLFWSGARKSKGRNLFRIWTRNDPGLFNLDSFKYTHMINLYKCICIPSQLPVGHQ